jgi:hypothetical protein
LVVHPAAGLPELTLDAGGTLAIVNATPTYLDPAASFLSRQRAGELLGEAAALLKDTVEQSRLLEYPCRLQLRFQSDEFGSYGVL